jgi:glyoxylase-like metal-dependent hydrolase (beta-lactamase superfamily II)
MHSLRTRVASWALIAAALLPWGAQAQDLDKLPNYVPVLPAVKARALAVDPSKGFLVKEVKPNVYVVTDGIYQSAFVTSGKGVVLFDAPPSFADKLPAAVAEVTKEPITQIVYSHAPWTTSPAPRD